MFHNVGLIGKPGDERVADALEALAAFFQARSIAPYIDSETATAFPALSPERGSIDALGERCDLIIIVGGDGTFLNAAGRLLEHDVRLLGIHLGRLGFLADLTPDEMLTRLEAILAGEFEEEQRFLLEVEVIRDGNSLMRSPAINDVVVHKWNMARLIEFQSYVDTHLVAHQRSDGLIVSTATGSTAYALSGGGPIVHPRLDAIVLVPICPHTLTSRPIVVNGDSAIEVVMGNVGTGEAQISCDGQAMLELARDDRVRIRKKQRRLKLIHPKGYDYFAMLRTKLHWDWGRET